MSVCYVDLRFSHAISPGYAEVLVPLQSQNAISYCLE